MKHLVLVGLPGAGKTTLGRAAAAAAGLGFVDFDEEIERRSGLQPAAYFERHGEAQFRAEELALSKELVGHHTIVVSPGGGWITQKAARDALRPHARLVYLKVSPATAVLRLGAAVRDRPLLAGNPIVQLERLLAERGLLYESADYVVDTEVVGIEQLTDRLAQLASEAKAESG